MTTIIDTIDTVVRTRLKPKRGRGNGLGVVTHAQVAEALGLHWEQWSQYRRGTVPKLATLESMADAAGLVLTRRPEGEWRVRRPLGSGADPAPGAWDRLAAMIESGEFSLEPDHAALLAELNAFGKEG